MVERARERLHQHLVDGRVTLIHAALEDFVRDKTAGYDLVLAHALLEWLPDPWRGLEQLLTLVRPGGWLSLAVYNTAGRRVRQITRGEVAALRNPLRPGGSRLAPLHSFGVDELDNFLSKVGCERLLFAGLRTVSDYLPAPKRETLSLDELNALDEQYRLLSPFREMSTYLHMLWKVPDILKSRQHLNGPDRPRHHRPE
jgi:S-adenosylmethionine-dependent methyltransferase